MSDASPRLPEHSAPPLPQQFEEIRVSESEPESTVKPAFEPTGASSGQSTAASRSSATRPTKEALRRRRIVASAIAGVIVLAVVALVIFLSTRGEPDPIVLDPIPGETITAPVPTPAVAPVERDTSTALLAALPNAVLQWSVAAQAGADEVRALGALEAHTLTYTDGSAQLTVLTAQWRTPEAAQAYVASLGLEGTPIREEDVLVGGQATGRMAVYSGEAADTVVWTNGNTSFFVTAPVGAGATFYDAFGL